ncbi:MAG: ohrR [Clostridia bacterium]|nr:ohrR [Clostridia bacterium]
MDNDDILKLENQLCFSVYAASRAITKIYRPFLDKLGITYPQYLVMLILWEDETITLKDLCKKLYLDSGTLTPLLKRLESMELIKRVRSMEDERILCVSLAEKGRAMKTEAIKVPECVLGTINADVAFLANLKGEVDKLLKDIKE